MARQQMSVCLSTILKRKPFIMQHFHIKPFVFLLTLAFAQQTLASGYHFGTQSVTAQSTANAAAAEANNASTIFSNPAGLNHLKGHEVSATVNLVAPSIKYSDAQAQYYQEGEVTGSDSGKITDDVVFAPHMYGAYKVSDRLTLGLGMYVPFGSSTEYSKDSKLRYNINQLGLTTLAIEPTIAFKPTERHSFGVGVIAQYSKAELRKFADWSASLDNTRLKGMAGLLPNASADRADWAGYADVKGSDWGFGYHLGWMFDVNDRVRVGAAYRSKVEHNLKGSADWKGAGVTAQNYFDNAPLNIGKTVAQGGRGYVTGEDASVKIITPESLSVHGMYKATDKLNLFGDVTWTRHSRFNQVDLVFENAKLTPKGGTSNTTTIKPNWRDTFKVALGGSYQYSEPLQLRAGVAFDQSPVRSAEERLNTLPDGNRIWFSVGAQYQFKKRHQVDVAYSHIHINDTEFTADKATGNDVDSKGATSAKFNNFANILGVQYTYKF